MNNRASKRALELLRDCQKSDDIECAHGDADDVLCKLLTYLGYKEVVEAYEEVDKFYA